VTEPRWLTLEHIKVAHERQLARFGGPAGIRDEGALVSATMRRSTGGNTSRPISRSLQAAYAFGLARNHPFVDGNKRVAFVAMMLFLRKNGIRFSPPPADATAIMLALAAGQVNEAGLTRWIKDNWP
jgi:death-on-curing protein